MVEEAKQAGYTEPDPRDDLSGTDVARKVNTCIMNLISAGHGSGLPISFGTLSVTHRVGNLIFGHICIFPLVCYIDCLARTCTINTKWVPSLPVTIWHGWMHWTQIAICLHFFYYKFHAQLKKIPCSRWWLMLLLQVIILARESGLKLELSDIPVQSLVPEPLRVR